jgi:hypothetical protein
MSPVFRLSFRRFVLSTTAFALIAGGGVARAQTPLAQEGAVDNNSAASSPNPTSVAQLAIAPAGSSTSRTPSSPSSASTNSPTLSAPPGPEFLWNASVNFSESYVTNAAGVSGAVPDYLSNLGFASDLHEHSRRITLDANYSFLTNFYAKGTEPTQISNNLLLVGDADVIPEYLDVSVRAFAQPVVNSNFGAVTAGNRVIPGSYSNAYGYYGTPDLKFNLGDFATFKTMPSYGQVFFTEPAGTAALQRSSLSPLCSVLPSLCANTVPGFDTPQNTTSKSVTEQVSSGTDFERLNWRLTGLLSETDQAGSLLSEKSGIANGRYALSYEWSLIATGGYDALSDTIPLTHNVSGPVALGGVGLTLGRDFALQVEAGERYNSLSFDGNLHYDLSPSSLLTASAIDYVQTPGGQLLNNLSALTALPNGILTSASDVLGNGMASSLASFSVQSPNNFALTQFTARYQTVSVAYLQEFGRNHAYISLFGSRQTILSSEFIGPPTGDSWTAQLLVSRNLTPLLTATLGGSYGDYQEFGVRTSTLTAEGELEYSLSQATRVFLRSNFVDRLSSESARSLSPLSGNVNDVQVTLGISHIL